MSSKLPAVSSKEIVKILEKKGFIKVRQCGNTSGKRATVTIHSSKIIGKGLLRQIMKGTDISPEDFNK